MLPAGPLWTTCTTKKALVFGTQIYKPSVFLAFGIFSVHGLGRTLVAAGRPERFFLAERLLHLNWPHPWVLELRRWERVSILVCQGCYNRDLASPAAGICMSEIQVLVGPHSLHTHSGGSRGKCILFASSRFWCPSAFLDWWPCHSNLCLTATLAPPLLFLLSQCALIRTLVIRFRAHLIRQSPPLSQNS